MFLYREPYGLLVKASRLGDPRVIQLCETIQTAEFRRVVSRVPGYKANLTGTISYEVPEGRPS
jgi:hypothetical protein